MSNFKFLNVLLHLVEMLMNLLYYAYCVKLISSEYYK